MYICTYMYISFLSNWRKNKIFVDLVENFVKLTGFLQRWFDFTQKLKLQRKFIPDKILLKTSFQIVLGTFFNHEKNEWLYYFSNGIAVVVYIITGIVGRLASLMQKHSERLRLIHFKQYLPVLFPNKIAVNHISFYWQDFFSIDVQRSVIPSGIGNHTGDLWWKFLPIQFWLCYLIVAYHRSHVVSHCFHQ